MSEIKLKPCPFCGNEAEFHRTPIKTNGSWCDSVVVRCKQCEARTNRVLYDARKHQNDSEYDEAAKAWNQRKPVEKALERLEEAKDNAVTGVSPKNIFSHIDWVEGFDKAVEIIKEEVG